jgi:hypothetical protein
MEDAAAKAAAAAAAAAGFAFPPSQTPQHQVPTLASNSFSPQYNFASLPGPTPGPNGSNNNNNNNNNNNGGMDVTYDPMFGSMPTNAFSSPAAWHGDDERNMPRIAASPGGRSYNGSAGTGPGEEKDPFLSLLEQLAENENAHGPGSDLDFFLAGAQN